MPSLIELINFIPQNDVEKNIFDSCNKDVLNDYLQDTKPNWYNGIFYLGGFIKMKADEDITIKKIDDVKKIREQRYREDMPTNSVEIASVKKSDMQLYNIEIILQKYQEIKDLRIEKELKRCGI
jgi:hypothetical protein